MKKIYETRLVNEVNMSPTAVRSQIADLDAIVGIEYEMIVVDFFNGLYTPDYFKDARIDIYDDWDSFADDITNFFLGDYNSKNEINFALRTLHDDYQSFVTQKWEKYLRDNFDRSKYDSEEDFEYEKQDDFYSDKGSIESWAKENKIKMMSNLTSDYEEYKLKWPYYIKDTTLGSGNRSFEEVATDLESHLGHTINISHSHGEVTRHADEYVLETDVSVKSDSEFDFGLELVSPPFDLKIAIDQLILLMNWANSGNAYTNSTCGLHINVSLPNYSMRSLDYIKLLLFLGDEYILGEFGRIFNTYAVSGMKTVKQQIIDGKISPDKTAAAFLQMKNGFLTDASKSLIAKNSDRQMSVNVKKNNVEFRSAGNDWLDDEDRIIKTIYRMVYALHIALDPTLYRKEYTKKLYKLLTSKSGDDKSMLLFSKLISGEISKDEFKLKYALKNEKELT